MKQLLSLVVILGISYQARTAVGQMAVKMGTWSYSTENVGASSESASGVGAYAFEFGYAVSPKWMASFGVNLIMSDLISGSAGFGFDLGVKYFYLSDATTSNFQSDELSVTVREALRPYAGLFMRQRTFGLLTSVSYLGPGLTLGVDYSLSKKWLATAEFRYDNLYGQGQALATQTNILLGLAIEF